MTATAERIERDFATLSRDEQEALFSSLYQRFFLQANEEDWAISEREERALLAAAQEAEREFKAGKSISNEEMKRWIASWLKTSTR